MVTCAIYGIFAAIWYRVLEKRVTAKWFRVIFSLLLALVSQFACGMVFLLIDPTLAQ